MDTWILIGLHLQEIDSVLLLLVSPIQPEPCGTPKQDLLGLEIEGAETLNPKQWVAEYLPCPFPGFHNLLPKLKTKPPTRHPAP